MASPRNRRHIIVQTKPVAEPYKPVVGGSRAKLPVPENREYHGRVLKQSFEAAAIAGHQRRADAGIQVPGAFPGIYVQIESQPGVSLELSTLEHMQKGIEVVAVTYARTNEPEPRLIELATVFVPEGQVKHFISRCEIYAQPTPKKKNETRHEGMLDRVAHVRLATLRAFWTDSPETYPEEDEPLWWEVWLRRHDGGEVQRLMAFAEMLRLPVGKRRLQFDDRIITLVHATAKQLSASIDVLNDVAEVRRAKDSAAFFVGLSPLEQANWAKDLIQRVTIPDEESPAVCVLDTGVNRSHPLLEIALSADDCLTCNPAWAAHDHNGHGTQMAGLALYGDLTPVLSGSESINLRHRLESVKILSPTKENPPELYGAITAEATSRVEIQNSGRRRCFSMAVTAPDQRDRGQPTSWSAAVDALAAGRMFDPGNQGLVYIDDGGDPQRRLFVVSAGNVGRDVLEVDHLNRSDTEPIHDPAQAWNALTVGAFTNKVTIQDPDFDGWQPLAAAGELSPWSTTSVSFADDWPIKPDVVFEGGNAMRNGNNEIDSCADLCLLSTHAKIAEKHFVVTDGTSAATALAARMAAMIWCEYPLLWPEAVRGLVVHSARWRPNP